MKKSKTSAIIEKILKLAGNKKRFETVEQAKNYLKKCEKQNKKPYKVPTLYRNFATAKRLDNQTYYESTGSGENVVLYLHGGAFVNRPLVFHWFFLYDLKQLTNATIFFPIYPLAPEFTAKDTYKFLLKLYKHILLKHKSKNITIMGDSAGGTLSLSLTDLLKRKNLPLPARVIAFSPSLDIKFEHKKIDKVEMNDPMLSRVGCAFVCQFWARNLPYNNPLASPKFIDLEGYPPLYIFAGTNEILYPEIRDFVKMAKLKKYKVFYTEQKGMNHVYPLFPIPEAKKVKEKVAKLITGKNL